MSGRVLLEEPSTRRKFLVAIDDVTEVKQAAGREAAAIMVASLTVRQREILNLVLAGHPSKNIAADLGISQRTVDNHRAAIMKKTGSKSLPALVRTALAAA
jgi:two-component system CheB/CheR fusion protein